MVGQAEVGQHEVYRGVDKQLDGSANRCGLVYLKPFLAQPRLQHGAKSNIIFYY